MKRIFTTLVVAATTSLLPTPSSAACTGNRIRCSVVGANDALGCAQYSSEGCYWLGSNEVEMPYCAGDPLDPCSSFSMKDQCQVHQGCIWSGVDEGDQGSPPPPSESNIEGSYSGTAAITLQYYSYDVYTGQDYFDREVNNQYPIQFTIGNPLTTGGEETNPFWFSTVSDDLNPPEGYISLASAFPWQTSTGPLLLQYWTFSLDGSTIQGSLTKNGLFEGQSGNFIYANDLAGYQMINVFPIAEGTTMAGTITATDLHLTVNGQNENTYVRFSVDITASADGAVMLPGGANSPSGGGGANSGSSSSSASVSAGGVVGILVGLLAIGGAAIYGYRYYKRTRNMGSDGHVEKACHPKVTTSQVTDKTKGNTRKLNHMEIDPHDIAERGIALDNMKGDDNPQKRSNEHALEGANKNTRPSTLARNGSGGLFVPPTLSPKVSDGLAPVSIPEKQNKKIHPESSAGRHPEQTRTLTRKVSSGMEPLKHAKHRVCQEEIVIEHTAEGDKMTKTITHQDGSITVESTFMTKKAKGAAHNSS